MEAYETLGILGEGTYGIVMKARSRITGKLVAIKRFKQSDEDDHVCKTSTREVRMLQQLRHPNIVRLEDVFRRDGKLYLVFEYIDHTILQVLESTTRGIPARELRRYIYQLLRGVEFCHANNVIHRDVKPENVLIDQTGMLKLCDFGFARQMTTKGKYTDYVATRWYRAPELLVGDVSYSKPVDVWALGCMFAELSDGQPLFPGESDLDQLCLILQACGAVPHRMVSIFEHNPLYRNVSFPHTGIVYTLRERYHKQSDDWLQFLSACLHPDPAKRLTCTQLMALPYFNRDNFRERYEAELRSLTGLPTLLRPSIPGTETKGDANHHGSTTPNVTTSPSLPSTVTNTVSKQQQQQSALGDNDMNLDNVQDTSKDKMDHDDEVKGFPPIAVHGSLQSESALGQLATLENHETPTATPAAAAVGTAVTTGLTDSDSHTHHQYHGQRRYQPSNLVPVLTSDEAAAGAAYPEGANGVSNSDTLSRSGGLLAASFRKLSMAAQSPSVRELPPSANNAAGDTAKSTSTPMQKKTMAGATYPDPHRRSSHASFSLEKDGEETPTVRTPKTEFPGVGEVGSVVPAAPLTDHSSRRVSRSIQSLSSSRSNSLRSSKGDSSAARRIGAGSSQMPSRRVSQENDDVVGTQGGSFHRSGGSKKVSGSVGAMAFPSPSHVTSFPIAAAIPASTSTRAKKLSIPLVDRLPDLTSPNLHLPACGPTAISQREVLLSGEGTGEISKLLHHSIDALAGPSSLATVSNPLASPPSREHADMRRDTNPNSNNAGKAYQSSNVPGNSVSYATGKKKLTKRKKDGAAAAVTHHNSHRNDSHDSVARAATKGSNPQEQILEYMRARSNNTISSTSENFKTASSASGIGADSKSSTPRSITSLQERQSSHELPDSSAHNSSSSAAVAEKQSRLRQTAQGASAAGAVNLSRTGVPEPRNAMPRSERRSKPLQASSPSPFGSDSRSRTQTQTPQLQQTAAESTALQSDSIDVTQRASATLLALAALRQNSNTASVAPHPSSKEPGTEEKTGVVRHTRGAPLSGITNDVSASPAIKGSPSLLSPKDAMTKIKKPAGRGRKPVDVRAMQSGRRSVDEGITPNPLLHYPYDNHMLTSSPMLMSPYKIASIAPRSRRISNAIAGTGNTSSVLSTAAALQAQRKTKKKRGSAGGANTNNPYPYPYTARQHGEDTAPPGDGVNTTTHGTHTSEATGDGTARRRKSSNAAKGMLPLMYNAATAAATQI